MKVLTAMARALSCAGVLLVSGCGGSDGDAPVTQVSGSGEAPGATIASASASTARWSGSGIGAFELAQVLSHPVVRAYLSQSTSASGSLDVAALSVATASAMQASSVSSLSSYEVSLPHATQSSISKPEQRLLAAYLDQPADRTIAAFLALLHLERSLVNIHSGQTPGAALRHTLMAQYFLHRVQSLGSNSSWVAVQILATQRAIDRLQASQPTITSEETHPAHAYFLESFNYKEENRYRALDRLLEDYCRSPRNVYTAFTLNAVNLWIGGEADKSDPTVLENFVLGSYFSLQAMDLAHRIETAWQADPAGLPRFRMATILGGFAVLHRRWLLQVHHDQPAIDALDDEHRQWRLIHRAFHAFTVGLAFFDEPEHFREGKAAWEDAFAHCQQSAVRTCSNLPRFTHNFSTFVLGYVDFLLKNGDVDTARYFLSLRQVPDQVPGMALYPQWTLGRDAWVHREQYADSIAQLYADADPANDPGHLLLRHRRWGGPTSTCQLCHQAQATVWTEQQQLTLGATLPPPDEASVGQWPAVSVSWYGTLNPPAATR